MSGEEQVNIDWLLNVVYFCHANWPNGRSVGSLYWCCIKVRETEMNWWNKSWANESRKSALKWSTLQHINVTLQNLCSNSIQILSAAVSKIMFYFFMTKCFFLKKTTSERQDRSRQLCSYTVLLPLPPSSLAHRCLEIDGVTLVCYL